MDDHFYYAREVRGLIGDDKFSMLIAQKFFDYFYPLSDASKTGFWKAIIHRINEGISDFEELVKFADSWLLLFYQIRKSIHKSILN